MVWLNDFLYKEEKQRQPFPREEHLAKVFLTGFIISKPKMEINGERIIFETSINGYRYPILFWTKDFGLNQNMAKLWEELNKIGTPIKAHGNYIEVGNTKLEGITCSWEVSEVKEQFLIHYVEH